MMRTTNTNTNTATTNTATSTVRNAVGWMIAAVALTMVLGACGNRTAPETAPVAAQAETVTVTEPEAALQPEAAPETETPSGDSPRIPAAPSNDAAVAVSSDDDDDTMAANECYGVEYPAAEWVGVWIPGGSVDDGPGVNVHADADGTSPVIASFPTGTMLNVLPHDGTNSCQFNENDGVWWAVWISETEFGWASSDLLDDGSYVDEDPYVEDDGLAHDHVDQPEDAEYDDVEYEEESDVHGDCFSLNVVLDECVVVFRGAQGITYVDSVPSAEWMEWARLECDYQGNADACIVLDLLNYERTNELTMAPTEALAIECDQSGAYTAAGALACAEFFTRNAD